MPPEPGDMRAGDGPFDRADRIHTRRSAFNAYRSPSGEYLPSVTQGGVVAVALEVELAFEGVVDRLDGLAQRLEETGEPHQQASMAVGVGICRRALQSFPHAVGAEHS